MRLRKAALIATTALTQIMYSGPASSEQIQLDFRMMPDFLGSFSGELFNWYDDSASSGRFNGEVKDAYFLNPEISFIHDPYDGYGKFTVWTDLENNPFDNSSYRSADGFNGLTGARQVATNSSAQGLPLNSIRWYDTFTNNTADTVSVNLAFGGDLGSDNNTHVHSIDDGFINDGFVITGRGALGDSAKVNRHAVILHLVGNNQYALSEVSLLPIIPDSSPGYISGEEFGFGFPVIVAPGETVAIMNMNVLFISSDRSGATLLTAYENDVALARAFGSEITTQRLYVNSPVFTGLTADQVGAIINWDVVFDGSLPVVNAASSLAFSLHDNLHRSLRDRSGVVAGAPTCGVDENTGVGGNEPDCVNTGFVIGGLASGSEQFSLGEMQYTGSIAGFGLEHQFAPNFDGGIVVGQTWGSADIREVYSDISSSQNSIVPYLRWADDRRYEVFASLSYGRSDFSYIRTAGAGVASAVFEGTTFGANLEASTTFKGQSMDVSPFVGFSHQRLNVAGYDESGAGAANLSVPDYSVTRTDIYAGARLDTLLGAVGEDGEGLRGFAGAGIGVRLGSSGFIETAYQGSANMFQNTFENDREIYGIVEFGVTGELSETVSLEAVYNGNLGSNMHDHTASLSIRMSF